ncbi:hypothetical protein GMLC_31240 [Geomonas limicola]|uniref:Uncharacterized protein n=1 Tax=Geomonas limicola TaxID=2740186 RepID=A0A6V8NAA1_9BACT|nr:CxxxxCH/CxxCH domain-containing protein [Geomonas limicola]GFO69545.1 hypothetical protein GMLC_31240 [Geomonas limicola]
MRSWIKNLTLLCLAGALCACSNGNGNSATGLVDNSGKHAANWLEQHWSVAANLKGILPAEAAAKVAETGTACAQCHGKDLLGGISKVSCFSAQLPNGLQCHATKIGHPDGWGSNAMYHGKLGAMAAGGFAFCARCHSLGTQAAAGKTQTSCSTNNASCHNSGAPHPAKPWNTGNIDHGLASSTNAAVCALCHANGSNFRYGIITSTKAAGSPNAPTPDCYNNTMCHGGQVTPPDGHQTGSAYLAAAQHGPDAAGVSAGHVGLGLAECAKCHADRNTGRFDVQLTGSTGFANGCETCHTKQHVPHPTPWLSNRTIAVNNMTPGGVPNQTSHSIMAQGNVGNDCTGCHGTALDGGTGAQYSAPNCMSGSLSGIKCHFQSLANANNRTGCVSCHDGQTQVTDSAHAYTVTLSAFTNNKPTSGIHGVHTNASKIPGLTCEACHSGGGADPVSLLGNPRHANGFFDISSASYWAKGASFNYDRSTKTCSNVRCHGGSTPKWDVNAFTPIDVTQNCDACHEQSPLNVVTGVRPPATPQFNSYYSGQHDFHLNPANHAFFPGLPITCQSCHTLTADQHFRYLANPNFPTANGYRPIDTVNLNAWGGVLDKTAKTCANVSCHNSPNAKSWN